MEPVKIFYCCTNVPEDKDLRDKIHKHLMSLKRLDQITMCLTRDILAGTDWSREHDERLQMADLILPLISANFIASDYHYGREMQDVLTRQQTGDVIVIPVLLSPTYIQGMPLEKFQILPRDKRSIQEHPDHDLACFEIVGEISEIVVDYLRRKYTFLSMADTQILPNGSPIVNSLCATCGEQNEPGRNICSNCWDLLYTDEALAFSPPPAPIVGVGNAVICPKCGRSNRPGAKFCKKDGQPLSISSPANPIIPQSASSPPVLLQVGPAPQAGSSPPVLLQTSLPSPVSQQVGVFSQVGMASPYPPYTRLQLDSVRSDSEMRRSFVADGTVSEWSGRGQIRAGRGGFQHVGKTCTLRRDSSGISMMYASAFPNFGRPVSFDNFAFQIEMEFLPPPACMRAGIVFRTINDARGQKYYYFSLCTDNTCSLDFIENNRPIHIEHGPIAINFGGPVRLGGIVEDDVIKLSINSLQLNPVVDQNCSRGSIGIAIGDLDEHYHSEVRFSRLKVWTR